MKRKLIIAGTAVLFIVLASATVLASGDIDTLAQRVASFIRYDFDDVKERPDTGSGLAGSWLTLDNEMIFEPYGTPDGWLSELSGGGALTVNVGSLDFGDGGIVERYIDIRGENGEVRLLQNSGGAQDGYTATQFWSAKQQEGSSVVKDFSGEIRSAVLYELPDGSCRLIGYTEGEGSDFWAHSELPETDCYRFEKE